MFFFLKKKMRNKRDVFPKWEMLHDVDYSVHII